MAEHSQTAPDGCCGGGVGPVPYPGCVDCPRAKVPEFNPEPGWLAADIARADARLREWGIIKYV
jgi:hypothetical protein